MDRQESGITFTGMDPLPIEDDDDEIVTVGEPIWDVIDVQVVAPLTLAVEFENGVKGRVRFETDFLTGFFAKLNDPDYFDQVGIQDGYVSWPNEEPDLSPSRMYEEIVANDGEWVLQ
jgi:Protein of unknown function (DUF2442)